MKNNKKGFVFIETIITIVFLAAALLILYSSYRNAILEERKRIYYDDISYLYRNYYIADFLINKTEIHDLKDTAFEEKYAVEIDNNFKEKLFSEYQTELNYPEELDTIEKKFNVDKMMFVSEELITECFNAKGNDKCEESYRGLSDGLAKYLETMEIDRKEDDNTTYYLVTEYREKSSEEGIEKCERGEENCSAFYVTLKLDINKKIEVPDALIGEACRGQNFAQCLKDNYTIENDTEDGSGIYHHDGNGTDSGYGDYEAGDDSYRYAGGNPNNYICFGSDEEACPEENLYRIIGVYGNNIKIIKEQDNKTGWNELNTRNINYSEKWNNMIENSSWNTNGMSIDKISLNAKGVYGAEITGATKNSKTGLMYVNEYMYGASPKYWVEKGTEYSKAKDNNWLFTGNEWMLTKVQGVANQAYVVSTEGNVGSNLTSESITARGSAVLKDTIILTGGIGTREQPFRITDNGAVVKDIELATEVEGYYDIEVNVVAESQEGSILKYYFSYKKHSDSTWSNWIEDNDKNHLFEGLESDTEYDIKAKVLNNRGIESEEYQKTFKTQYAGPKVEISEVSHGIHNIKVKVNAVVGTSEIKKYDFYLNNSLVKTITSNNLVYEYDYTGLNSNTEYTLSVIATDISNFPSEKAEIKVKTDYEEPKVDLAVTTVDYYSLTAKATGTAGSGAIKQYDYYLNGTRVATNNVAGSNTYTYKDLSDGVTYTLKVIVTDVNGHTAEKTITSKTNPVLSPTLNITTSASIDYIVVYPNATARSGSLKTCRYNIGSNSWVTDSCSSHTFTSLTKSTNYTISVEVTNTYNKTTTNSTTAKTLDVVKPSVRITNAYGTGVNSIRIEASGTKGTNAISRYEYYVDGVYKCTKSTSSTSSSCDISGLSINTSYSVRVDIYDSQGYSASAYGSARTLAVVKPSVRITNAYGSGTNSIYVSASATVGTYSISRYEYYADGVYKCTRYDSYSSSCDLTGLSRNTYYSIRVDVYDSQGNSASAYDTAKTLDLVKPSVRISSAYATGPNSIHVDAYVTAGTYSISSVDFSANSSTKCTKYSSGSVSCDMTGLSPSTYYSIRVTAYDTQYNSAYDTSSATTDAQPAKTCWQYEGCWKYYENGSTLKNGWYQLRETCTDPYADVRYWYFNSSGCLVTGWNELPYCNGCNWSCYFYIDANHGMRTSGSYYCYDIPSNGCAKYNSSRAGCGSSSGGSGGSSGSSCTKKYNSLNHATCKAEGFDWDSGGCYWYDC